MDREETENMGVSLLKKGRKRLSSLIFSRLGLILVLMAVQLGFLFGIFQRFETFLPHVYGGTAVFTVVMVLYLLNSRLDPTAKITWLVVILLMPVFGSLLYLFTQSEVGHRALRGRLSQLIGQSRRSIAQPPEALAHLEQTDPGAAGLARYLERCGGFPVAFQNVLHVLLRHQQNVYRCLGVDVAECKHPVVLIHLRAGNFSRNNLTEQAVHLFFTSRFNPVSLHAPARPPRR